MEPKYLRIHKLDPNAILPTKAHPEDAGWDLYALRDITLPPGQSTVIPTGIAMEIPTGYYGRVADRSSLAVKYNLTCGAGVIDANYRGEIGVVLFNLGREAYNVSQGDRVAQLIITAINTSSSFLVVDTLSETTRGAGKFGSTGV
jgi:dUTP pyrophosphatase